LNKEEHKYRRGVRGAGHRRGETGGGEMEQEKENGERGYRGKPWGKKLGGRTRKRGENGGKGNSILNRQNRKGGGG
jgi:hypothetical protein